MSPWNRPSAKATHARNIAALAAFGTNVVVSGFNGNRPTPRRNRSRGGFTVVAVRRDPRWAWSVVFEPD